jgi:Family of unknown function (DUF6084)
LLDLSFRVEAAELLRFAASPRLLLKLGISATAGAGGAMSRSLLWTNATLVVPGFEDRTFADLALPCTFDFNVAAAKYFYALEDGEVPLSLLFSGTVFEARADGGLAVSQVPWEKGADFRLPVQVWKEVIDLYYPDSAWLCVRRDIFDRLYLFKSVRGLPTWELALEARLGEAARAVER